MARHAIRSSQRTFRIPESDGRRSSRSALGAWKFVLEALRRAGLFANSAKMQLNAKTASVLGHLVDEEGVHPDPSKVAALQQAPQPKSKDDIRSLMGAVNFLHRYLPHHAEKAEPLTKLLKKSEVFVWGP
eukprot:GHVS01017531.1.p1 GENE.GHVS01017531.1~~GHVS01017531.1.p1  ORF type:complete len:130 (-),score=8.49 GHVS01017531.1:83-472(-)